MSNPFDFDDAAPADAPQTGSRPGSRRPVLGPASLSIGGFVILAGGLMAILAAFMPGHIVFDETAWSVLLGGRNPRRALYLGVVALGVGGAFLRVRVVYPPLAGDYVWTGMGLVAGLLVALLLLLSGSAAMMLTKLALNTGGVASLVVLLASITVAFGAALRTCEQVSRWRKPRGYDPPADDPPPRRPETDRPLKPKPRPRPDARPDPKR